MNGPLQPHESRAVAAPAKATEDPFAIVMRPGKPTLDAIAQLKPSVDWVVTNEKRPYFDLDVRRPWEFTEEAAERLRLIPPLETLQRAEQLFSDAERIPAPEAWLHLSIGLMLSERPNAGKVSPTYRFGIVDSMLYDEEYAPGFSQAVVIRALRELRKTQEFVPAPAEVLKACALQKRFFRDLRRRTEQLISVRENAEEIIAEDKRQFEEDFGGSIGPVEPRLGWRAPVYDDDGDVPF